MAWRSPLRHCSCPPLASFLPIRSLCNEKAQAACDGWVRGEQCSFGSRAPIGGPIRSEKFKFAEKIDAIPHRVRNPCLRVVLSVLNFLRYGSANSSQAAYVVTPPVFLTYTWHIVRVSTWLSRKHPPEAKHHLLPSSLSPPSVTLKPPARQCRRCTAPSSHRFALRRSSGRTGI